MIPAAHGVVPLLRGELTGHHGGRFEYRSSVTSSRPRQFRAYRSSMPRLSVSNTATLDRPTGSAGYCLSRSHSRRTDIDMGNVHDASLHVVQ